MSGPCASYDPLDEMPWKKPERRRNLVQCCMWRMLNLDTGGYCGRVLDPHDDHERPKAFVGYCAQHSGPALEALRKDLAEVKKKTRAPRVPDEPRLVHYERSQWDGDKEWSCGKSNMGGANDFVTCPECLKRRDREEQAAFRAELFKAPDMKLTETGEIATVPIKPEALDKLAKLYKVHFLAMRLDGPGPKFRSLFDPPDYELRCVFCENPTAGAPCPLHPTGRGNA